MPSGSEFVRLATGHVVPLPVVQVLWNLTGRGIRLDLEGENGIIAYPASLLTDRDRQAIRRWRHHVLAVLHESPTIQ